MRITRSDFFNAAVNLLYKQIAQSDCTYRQAIKMAQQELGIDNNQLRLLYSKDIESIQI